MNATCGGILSVHNPKPHINRHTCTTVLHEYWLDAKFRSKRLYWYSFWPRKRFCVNENLAIWVRNRPRNCCFLSELVMGEILYDYIASTSLHSHLPDITRYIIRFCSQKTFQDERTTSVSHSFLTRVSCSRSPSRYIFN